MAKAVYFCEDPEDETGGLLLVGEIPEDYYGVGSIYIPDLPEPHTMTILFNDDFHDVPLVEETSQRMSVTLEGFGSFYFKINRNNSETYKGQKEEYQEIKWFSICEEDSSLLEIACQAYNIMFVGETQ